MPKLSVIVPVYNTEKYLRECIDSILAQTFKDFELILVDDGSTDGSGAICDEYAKMDERIRVIHQENGGVTRARKSGVRSSAGIYFSFIDSDDWIHPQMFEQMVGKGTETNADIVICDVYLEYGTRSISVPTLAEEGFYNKAQLREQIYPAMLMHLPSRRPAILGSSCNKLFRKNVMDQTIWQVDDSFIYAEDALFCYAALLESDGVFVLRKPLYHYRQHSESAMHQYNGKKRYENSLRSYYAYGNILQNHGFDISGQLSAYISVNAVDVIRGGLLFDQKASLRRRLKQARDFAGNELVYTALCDNARYMQGRRDQWKMQLAKKGRVTFLYFLFAVRECMLRMK